jgi:hypothetical protein
LSVGRFPLPITLRSGIALELQAFSALPFQQTTDLVEKLRAQNVAFEAIATVSAQHPAIRGFKKPSRETEMLPRCNALTIQRFNAPPG